MDYTRPGLHRFPTFQRERVCIRLCFMHSYHLKNSCFFSGHIRSQAGTKNLFPSLCARLRVNRTTCIRHSSCFGFLIDDYMVSFRTTENRISRRHTYNHIGFLERICHFEISGSDFQKKISLPAFKHGRKSG